MICRAVVVFLFWGRFLASLGSGTFLVSHMHIYVCTAHSFKGFLSGLSFWVFYLFEFHGRIYNVCNLGKRLDSFHCKSWKEVFKRELCVSFSVTTTHSVLLYILMHWSCPIKPPVSLQHKKLFATWFQVLCGSRL